MHPAGEIDECPRLHVCAYAVTHVAVTHVAVTHVAVSHVAVTHVAATYVALPMWRYLGRYRHIGHWIAGDIARIVFKKAQKRSSPTKKGRPLQSPFWLE